ncbi:hypothetical protein BHM03_00013938 [Ensete ventricosum]|nr:hypothetical protein BHM03_00013938 [Ensete ventricosum]
MHVMHISLSSYFACRATHPFRHHPLLPFCHMLRQSEPGKLYFLRRPSKAGCKMNNSPAQYRRGKGWGRDKAGVPKGTARVVTVPLPSPSQGRSRRAEEVCQPLGCEEAIVSRAAITSMRHCLGKKRHSRLPLEWLSPSHIIYLHLKMILSSTSTPPIDAPLRPHLYRTVHIIYLDGERRGNDDEVSSPSSLTWPICVRHHSCFFPNLHCSPDQATRRVKSRRGSAPST